MTSLTVVIRSVGERTEAACRHLLAQCVPLENIVVVSNAPFSATLADCYRAGIARGLPWTLCIDADVLVSPSQLGELLRAAEEADESVCEIQGQILDKFFGIHRPAGNHLYRTALLPKALGLIPDPSRAIRPEHHTLSRMAELGHPWVELPLPIGIHDFEQYDRDIFRKCYVHARKFDALMHHLVAYWRHRAPQDGDYRVALAGLAAGIVETGEVRVDARRDGGYARWAEAEQRPEKGPLPADRITVADVERLLATWESPGEAMERYAAAGARRIVHGPSISPPAPPTGWWRIVPRAMGRALGRAGRRIERLAS